MLKSHPTAPFLFLCTMITACVLNLLDNHEGNEIFEYSKCEFEQDSNNVTLINFENKQCMKNLNTAFLFCRVYTLKVYISHTDA